jgi:hypothetical protein
MPTLPEMLRQGSWNNNSGDTTNQLVNALRGVAETGATLGTGALAGLAGMPYGVYKGITSGAYGTPEAPRIAAREAQQFMERNTYQPRTEQGQEYVQKLGNLFNESKLPPVMPEVAALGAIPKQAYAAQAERAGMAAEKALEPAIMRTMERGGKPAQLLQDLTQSTKSPLDVWHGSPHRFEKFDASKIGTGEGAQSYGDGLYLAESPDVAKSYRDKLTIGENYVNGEVLDPYNPRHYLAQVLNDSSGDVKEATEFLQTMALPGGSKSVQETALAALDLLKKGEKPLLEYVRPEGSLYKVDLPNEQIAKMLDWDKPLGQQSKEVQQAIEKTKSMLPPNAIDDLGGDLSLLYGKDVTPEQFLNTWESFGQKAGGESALAEHGVTGVRYLDQGSRTVSGGELLDVFETPSGWKSKIKVTNRAGAGFSAPTDTFTTSMPFKTEDEARQWALGKIDSGTSNFVVFPKYQDLLTIKEINDKPLGAYK